LMKCHRNIYPQITYKIEKGMNNISIIQGDITKAKVDVIVNAANPRMLGGGGVDGAIHRAAGPGLLEACRKVKAVNGIRCPFGQARLTEAADLFANYVIHAVGPRYKIDRNPAAILANAYRECLDLACEHGLTSIAFPAISCGAYGYPLDEAAYIAISTCSKEKYASLDISFYLYDKRAMSAWKTQMEMGS